MGDREGGATKLADVQSQGTACGSDPAFDTQGAAECYDMYVRNPSMMIGKTWGGVSRTTQTRWTSLRCDKLAPHLRRVRALAASGKATQIKAAVARREDYNLVAKLKKQRGSDPHTLRRNGTFSSLAAARLACGRGAFLGHAACCDMYVLTPTLVIGRTWGELPSLQRQAWQKMGCDSFRKLLEEARTRYNEARTRLLTSTEPSGESEDMCWRAQNSDRAITYTGRAVGQLKAAHVVANATKRLFYTMPPVLLRMRAAAARPTPARLAHTPAGLPRLPRTRPLKITRQSRAEWSM